MIRYTTPYSLNKNLAQAYNDEMARGKHGEYVAFYDRDTMFLTPDFGHTIYRYIKKYPGAFFTCYVNRTNCKWQRKDWIKTDDIRHHITYAEKLLNQRGELLGVEDHTDSQLWSGHLMVCPVSKWQNLTSKGLLGIDNEIHQKAKDNGHKILLMKHLYMYHWYSGYNGDGGHQKRDKKHLK